MKRMIFPVFAAFFLCCCMILPAFAADLQGGYYITGDSALGSGLTFYVPADYAEGALTYDSFGNLFNLTSSSIYLYCAEKPDYSIYASRFSGFQYRAGSGAGYQYQDLNLRNVTATNVQIFVADPAVSISTNGMLVAIVCTLIFSIAFVIILPKR